MRKWFCALALGALILVPAVASAQLPKATNFVTKPVMWRVSYGNALGYVDSVAKDITGWAAVCTTATIPTADWAMHVPAAAGSAVSPRFIITTPNTSTADSLYYAVDASYNGSTWFEITAITSAAFTQGTSIASAAFSAAPITIIPYIVTTAAISGGPFPFYRLRVGGSGSQAFSAARLTISYVTWQDQFGQGVNGLGKWEYRNISWENGPADSLVKNLAADDPDTTDVIDMADVDFSLNGAVATAQPNWRLSLWTDKTTSGLDSVYVTVETSNNRTGPWTKSAGGYTAANGFATPIATTSQFVHLPINGLLVTAGPGTQGGVWGARFIRVIIKNDEDGVIPQARLVFSYMTRDPR